jgi:hypothetical protein
MWSLEMMRHIRKVQKHNHVVNKKYVGSLSADKYERTINQTFRRAVAKQLARTLKHYWGKS